VPSNNKSVTPIASLVDKSFAPLISISYSAAENMARRFSQHGESECIAIRFRDAMPNWMG